MYKMINTYLWDAIVHVPSREHPEVDVSVIAASFAVAVDFIDNVMKQHRDRGYELIKLVRVKEVWELADEQ